MFASFPRARSVIDIYVNGNLESVEETLTVAQLLEQLGRKPLGLAVEINREVIPRSLHETTGFKPGDRVEIVHMVGGG
jgi:thiamine biosynthesis protein ThiS